MIDANDWIAGLRRLEVPQGAPVTVHASLSAFGFTQGGAATVVEALLALFDRVMAPAFTYTTMVTPEVGPPNNGMTYGSDHYRNRAACFFHPEMPVDRLMGVVPETLRRLPQAWRSSHPILSFTGVGVEAMLRRQTLDDPLAPLESLLDAGGWALLLGVDHTVNTSIHLGERLAARPAFLRWALTPQGVRECPHFPGCSDGFQALAPRLSGIVQSTSIGSGWAAALPLHGLVDQVAASLQSDHLALLCNHSYCERCADARRRIPSAGAFTMATGMPNRCTQKYPSAEENIL